jgi:hypothetical protein
LPVQIGTEDNVIRCAGKRRKPLHFTQRRLGDDDFHGYLVTSASAGVTGDNAPFGNMFPSATATQQTTQRIMSTPDVGIGTFAPSPPYQQAFGD